MLDEIRAIGHESISDYTLQLVGFIREGGDTREIMMTRDEILRTTRDYTESITGYRSGLDLKR